MAFPTALAAILSGASIGQLEHWRQTGLLDPELARKPKALYSFRDLVQARTVVWLRSDVSLQMVRQAFANLPVVGFTEHPSRYRFATDGKTIVAVDEGGHSIDLVRKVGQQEVISLVDIFESFPNGRGESVVDFRRPMPHLEVRQQRMGGWPTIENSRVPYDTIAHLLAGGDVAPEDVEHYYPGVSAEAARDAVKLDLLVQGVA